jgi:glycosyltransferase involved in cell wall biosynthesis
MVETFQKVALVAKPGGTHTGIGRYVAMLHGGLRAAGVDAVRVAPSALPLPNAGYALLRRSGVDLHTFLLNYPIWARYPRADVYHLTSQNLASLLLFRRPAGKVIVTVHDIIPYILRAHPQLRAYRSAADALFDRMAMAGLRRADHLVADSLYTRQCVIEHLGIAAERIDVVYLGIAHERFRPSPVPPDIPQRYGLPAGRRYLIYVGSEDPRKNLPALVRALAEVRRAAPDVEFIKVGRAHFASERQRLSELAVRLGVRQAIHFLDDVPEDDLPALYNLADVCVMPSLYEGFGFPALEAMACGTPVVCARASSLPEVVGTAGALVDPHDELALARTLAALLADEERRRQLGRGGREQAARFTWDRAVSETQRLYTRLAA